MPQAIWWNYPNQSCKTSNKKKVRECRRQRSEIQILLLHCCTLRKFLVTDSQTTRDQITRGRRSKRVWSNCVLCITFILSGSPDECWLHTCNACIITTWRLVLWAPPVARNNPEKPWVEWMIRYSQFTRKDYSYVS